MKNKIITMGLISALIGFFGCSNKKADNKTTKQESSVQSVNLNDLLYTTPTIENALPDFEDKTVTTNLQFHEDDWRQIEFLSKNQKGSIDKELAIIKEIYDNHSHKSDKYLAFKDVAVRDLLTQPLTIDFSKIKSYLTDKDTKINGVSLQNNPGQVRNGFSFSADGIEYYGQLDNKDKVKWLCIYSTESKDSSKASIEVLSKLLKSENLYLVDWRQMKIFDETNIKSDFVTDDKE